MTDHGDILKTISLGSGDCNWSRDRYNRRGVVTKIRGWHGECKSLQEVGVKPGGEHAQCLEKCFEETFGVSTAT